MSRKSSRNNKIFAGATVGFIAVIVLLVAGGNVSTNALVNTSQLSFVGNFRDLNCDAFNEITETKNGVKRTVASGRDGFNPLIDTTTLSLTSGGSPVESISVKLVLDCDGNLIDDASSSIVTGSFKMLLCGDPQNGGTKCFESDNRFFTTLNGQASSTIKFADVPIGCFDNSGNVIPCELIGDELITVSEMNLASSEIENLFPEGSGGIVITSQMFPQLTFTFNSPTGISIAEQDSFATNDQVYAQYKGLTNNAPPPPDSDGDGLADNIDQCTGQPEDFNGFEDSDGCPDADKLLLVNADSDGDGVNDATDSCHSTEAGASVNTDANSSNIGCSDAQIEASNNADLDADSDDDGIIDTNDICPNTTEGSVVDSNGCVLPVTDDIVVVAPTLDDADGDSIPDILDACEDVRGSVSNNGCPETITQPDETIFDDFNNLFNDDTGSGTPAPTTTQTPQTTTDRSGQATGNIVAGVDDFLLFVIGSFVVIFVIIGVGVAKGKVKA